MHYSLLNMTSVSSNGFSGSFFTHQYNESPIHSCHWDNTYTTWPIWFFCGAIVLKPAKFTLITGWYHLTAFLLMFWTEWIKICTMILRSFWEIPYQILACLPISFFGYYFSSVQNTHTLPITNRYGVGCCVWMCVWMCLDVFACVHVQWLHLCSYECVWLHLCTFVCTWLHLCTYVCMSVCVTCILNKSVCVVCAHIYWQIFH